MRPGGEAETDGGERRPHAFLGFGHSLVGQTDDVELGRTDAGHRHLNVDRHRPDPLKRDGGNSRDHHGPPATTMG